MKQTRLIMGMPITVEVLDDSITSSDMTEVFSLFCRIDEKFSPFKKNSEVSRMNKSEKGKCDISSEMEEILSLAAVTKSQSHGYFDIYHDGTIDPSGVVKGWAIEKAVELLKSMGYSNFFVDAGGDIQVSGSKGGQPWKVGIRNPFNRFEIVKAISLKNNGIATSGTYIRGDHIYNPCDRTTSSSLVSLTVIADGVLDADRMATAAFAMGENGIYFLESLQGYEAYSIDRYGVATATSGFEKFVIYS